MSRHLRQFRSGQSLVEFAVVALVLYMLLAAILTFGHALYVAQGLRRFASDALSGQPQTCSRK
jgi:Flp pilus assembly protein TadG